MCQHRWTWTIQAATKRYGKGQAINTQQASYEATVAVKIVANTHDAMT
jgi:hypothetical protein